MKVGVVVFPGSNCDDDIVHIMGDVLNQEVEKIWHKSISLPHYTPEDVIFLPGGFSYGDYLRSGAIARFSHIMESVKTFAEAGGTVIGICNGFQILCEMGMLEGTLLRNEKEKFISRNVYLKPGNYDTQLTRLIARDTVLKIPIAHAEGRYYAERETIRDLEENKQILFCYCDINGRLTYESNVNGSVNNIAGIMNRKGNVYGMMPHPERAAEEVLGNADGRVIFESILDKAYILT